MTQTSAQEVVRVFALDIDPAEAPGWAPRAANGRPGLLAEALGLAGLDPARVELFPASDLAGVGLVGYLVEGLGVDADALATDLARLDAETAHLVILHPGATATDPAQPTAHAPLRLLGAYPLVQAAPPAFEPPPQPTATPPEMTPATAPVPGRDRTLVRSWLLAVVFLALLAGFLALILATG